MAYLDRWNAATKGDKPLDGGIMAVSLWCAARLGETQKDGYVGYIGGQLSRLMLIRVTLIIDDSMESP